MDQIIEYTKTYQEYKAELDNELTKSAEGFVRIGYLLKVARDTDILKESGYATVTDFAQAEYNLDKTKVSRFIKINDKFSEGGYSDRLEDHFKGFGYAKLALMLQLPDEINEEITADFSKSEIQALKDEVDAENRITNIEVALEGETETTAVMEDDLGKTVKQLGEDDPQLYGDIWTARRQQAWSVNLLHTILAPAGQKVYSVRIRGVGRMELLVKDTDNGNEIVLINLRTSDKKRYTWEDMLAVWEAITAVESETGYKGAWESTYFTTWPLKEQVAPVQQSKTEKKPTRKKESKVQKAPEAPKEQDQAEAQEPEEEQLPGQMNVQDYPEILPVNYKEITDNADNEDTGAADSEADDHADQDHAGGPAGEIQPDGTGDADKAENVDGSHDDVSDGLGASGDAGESEEVPDRESLSEMSNVLQDYHELWMDVRKARMDMTESVDYLLRLAPGEEDPYSTGFASLEEVQDGYDKAVNLAAAIERVLIARQREEAK